MKKIKLRITEIIKYIQKYKSNNQGDSNTIRQLANFAYKKVNRLIENVERDVAPAMVTHFPQLSTTQQQIITKKIDALILYINDQKNSIVISMQSKGLLIY
jgi:Txe/YoeB family toxin of Txe-Axe toxin-antitoxin module